MRKWFVVISIFMVSAGLASETPLQQKPAFDVASVKLNTSGGPPGRTGTWNNRFIAENVPLILLIQYAYRPPDGVLLRQQVIGGPSWINTDRFDIEAKLDADTRGIPTREAWLMVQSLLENRFELKMHHETREMPVYDLLVAKGGAKMKLSEDQTIPRFDDEPDEPFDPAVRPPRGEASTTYTASRETILWGTAIPITPSLAARRPHSLLPLGLTTFLAGQLRRPVIDKTNLAGLFDFRLQFAPETQSANPEDLSGTSIFTAVQEQLGLKLESGKGPVDVLIIDSVQKPRAN